VVRDAVGHGFDEDGLAWSAAPAVVGEGQASRLLGRLVHGEDVVAVHPDRVDPVADPPAGDPVAPVLLQRRRRDRVPVVPADEDHGARARRGQVERRVEIALAGGAFAEVAGGDARREVRVLEPLQLQGVGGAGGLRDLCREGGGDGVLFSRLVDRTIWIDTDMLSTHLPRIDAAKVHRHVPALAVVVPVREQLAHELLQREAALLEDAVLTVLREDDVVGRQGRGGTDRDAFFACGDLFERTFSQWTRYHAFRGISAPCRSSDGPASAPRT